jgi:hypothetical protein
MNNFSTRSLIILVQVKSFLISHLIVTAYNYLRRYLLDEKHDQPQPRIYRQTDIHTDRQQAS